MKWVTSIAIIMAAATCFPRVGHAEGTSITLALAEEGRTNYSIVIARDAEAGEELAADELAYFLEQITGAKFPIRRDDEATVEHEIVLGHTSRKRFEDLPSNLVPGAWEGYAMLPEGDRLVIIGRIPRARSTGSTIFSTWNWACGS